MVKGVAALVLGLVLWVQAVWAQDAQAEALAALRDEIAQNPERIEARLSDLIAGYGTEAGLTPDGIEAFIALDRASARATALRRFIALDLDADGAVAAGEVVVAMRAASAPTRGRIQRQLAAADSDGDSRIDAGEIVAQGRAAALRALDEDEAAMLRAALALDTDGDGALSQSDLRVALGQPDDPA